VCHHERRVQKATNAPQVFREMTEEGAAETKENFDKMAAAAGEATGS
jgi:hypothetical protein